MLAFTAPGLGAPLEAESTTWAADPIGTLLERMSTQSHRPPSALPPDPPAPPTPTDDGHHTVFREVFLLHFEPEDRAVLRRGGDVIYTRILSAEPIRDREPWTHARLRALARDLDFAARYLAEIGNEPTHSEPVDPDETRLHAEAPAWARTARELVRKIRQAIGPPPDDDTGRRPLH